MTNVEENEARLLASRKMFTSRFYMLCSTPMTIAKFLLTRNDDKQPIERNRLPLFVNWIIQYFVSGLQNYRFSNLRTLHDCIGVLQFFMETVNTKK